MMPLQDSEPGAHSHGRLFHPQRLPYHSAPWRPRQQWACSCLSRVKCTCTIEVGAGVTLLVRGIEHGRIPLVAGTIEYTNRHRTTTNCRVLRTKTTQSLSQGPKRRPVRVRRALLAKNPVVREIAEKSFQAYTAAAPRAGWRRCRVWRTRCAI